MDAKNFRDEMPKKYFRVIKANGMFDQKKKTNGMYI